MSYLLDTHTFIWMDSQAHKLSAQVQGIVTNSQQTLYLSLGSVWEMQIKYQLGKLTLRVPLPNLLRDHLRKNRVELLRISLKHVLSLETLAHHHRDPFDRLLIAQALSENLTLLTNDSLIALYPVPIVW